MKISIVTGAFLGVPPAPCGAVERIWHDLAHEFVHKGHHVTLLCRLSEGQRARETVEGVRFIRRTRFKRSKSLAWDLIRDLIYSLRMLWLLPRADIVVTNTFWLPVLIPRLRPRAGKVVVNVQRVPKGQLKFYDGAARLAAVSNAIRDDIMAQHPPAAPRVRVIPNPINTHVFQPTEVASHGATIIYTGRVHPEKGIHLLIEAFALLHSQMEGAEPRLSLRIIGPMDVDQGGGGEEYVRDLRQKAGSLPVQFDAPIYDRPALAHALQAAQCFCYPSLAEKGESFGVAPLEAMATALVPVVSDLACFHDFIQDGQTGYFFDHRSPQAAQKLADALQKVLQETEQTKQMSQRAAQVAAGFGHAAIADQYLADFQTLIAA